MKFKSKINITFLLIIILIGCATPPKEPIRKKIIAPAVSSKYEIVDTAYNKFKARSHLLNGSTFQMQEKHADAILEFQEALKYDSSSAIFYACAKSYKDLKKFDNAKNALNIAISLDSNMVPAYDEMAEIFLISYDIKNAIRFIEKANKIDSSLDRKLSLARLYEFDDQNKAIQLYEESVKEKPDLFIYKKLAELYKKNYRNDDYAKTITIIFESDPSNIENVLEVTDIYLANKEYKKALDFATSLNDKFSDKELAGIVQSIGSNLTDDNYNGSESNIDRFVELVGDRYEDDWRINFITGILSLKIKKINNSSIYFNKTLKYADTIPDIPLQIATTYLKHGLNDSAVTILTKYEGKYSKDKRYTYFLAVSLGNLKKYEQAKIAIDKSIAIDATNFDAIAYSALIAEKLGNFDSSIKLFEYGLGIDPYNPTLNNNYAFSLAERDMELDKALKMSRIALQDEPNNPNYLDTYGWIMYKMGNYEESLKYVISSIENGANTAESWERLGDVYLKLNDKDKALDAFEKSNKLDPINVNVREKISKLKK